MRGHARDPRDRRGRDAPRRPRPARVAPAARAGRRARRTRRRPARRRLPTRRLVRAGRGGRGRRRRLPGAGEPRVGSPPLRRRPRDPGRPARARPRRRRDALARGGGVPGRVRAASPRLGRGAGARGRPPALLQRRAADQLVPLPAADRRPRGLVGRAMSAGLAALLDDVAALARMAAASVDDVAAGASRASVKAAGVIVDDAAVTPRYVEGFRPDRELPVIRRIAVGSLRNKLLFILPAALVLSELLPWLLTPLLMVGGLYLCYEGAEKLWEAVGPGHAAPEAPVAGRGPEREDALVGSAIRTDFILSAEIMVIALDEVTDEPLLSAPLILVIVALAITAVVYGAVGAIVKMDDVGLRLAQASGGPAASFGRGLVRAMPVVLSVLSKVGIAAMLWVGGHILLVGLDDLGLSGPYDGVHHLEEDVDDALGPVGGVGAWLTNTGASAVLGLIVGAIIVAVMHLRGGDHAPQH